MEAGEDRGEVEGAKVTYSMRTLRASGNGREELRETRLNRLQSIRMGIRHEVKVS